MRFVYGFGFETPIQRANNRAKGWDDEDSAALMIESDSEDEALRWGRAVAEAFFQWIYQDPEESWAAGFYVDYLEPETASSWTVTDLVHLQSVTPGQMPDLTKISTLRAPPPRPH